MVSLFQAGDKSKRLERFMRISSRFRNSAYQSLFSTSAAIVANSGLPAESKDLRTLPTSSVPRVESQQARKGSGNGRNSQPITAELKNSGSKLTQFPRRLKAFFWCRPRVGDIFTGASKERQKTTNGSIPPLRKAIQVPKSAYCGGFRDKLESVDQYLQLRIRI